MIKSTILNDIIDICSIQQSYQNKDISQILLPLNINSKNNKVNYDNFLDLDMKRLVTYFVETMENTFDKKDLQNLYHNFDSLDIKRLYDEDNIVKFINGNVGGYSPLTNQILLNKGTRYNVINHELLHASSSCYKDEKCYIGFYQNYNQDFQIGRAINEGYTELLNHRYFNGPDAFGNVYSYEVYTAILLEELIGKNKMESLYLNANLYGLVEELKKYTSEQEISEFLTKTDFCNYYLRRLICFPFIKNKLQISISYIILFLLKTNIIKIIKENKDLKSDSEINEIIKNFLISIPDKMDLLN